VDNLDIYNALKQPPKEALRTIHGGRLAGKTDINPQWRYKALTEQFGVCGIGWKYEIVRVFSEPADEGQIFAFAEVNLFVKQGEWSAAIPGYGGSMLVEKEKAGLHANDEGYKMAITDALSTATKMLGVAADVYAGLWDGTKYSEGPKQEDEPPNTHWCSIHKTPFFKKGKMKAYAHPIKEADRVTDTGEWCNETQPEPIEMPPNLPECKIDMAWLKESLENLDWHDCAKWLREHFKVTGTTVKALVESLTPEQQEEFVKRVQLRLDIAQGAKQ